ncbi:hypothetical protein B0H13DRAFT_2321718 [Mycena leptocephala]|nr:hypothetical protein B0H13DRAFT_2321718 [Mycena leptocephala]
MHCAPMKKPSFIESLRRQPPASSSLLLSLHSLGVDFNSLARHEDALRVYEEVVELPYLGVDFSSLGRHKDALRTDNKAVKLRPKLAATDPMFFEPLAASLDDLGIDFGNLGRHEEALLAGEEAVELWRKLADTDPIFIDRLAVSLRNLSVVFRNLGRRKDALRADAEIVKLRRQLHPTHGNKNIGGQSMRAGGATALAEDGAPPHVIQASGRWASNTF